MAISRRPAGIVACMVLGALMGVVAGTARADVVDIIDLHNNNSQGIPAPPYGIGTPVSVSGIVTSGVGTFTTEYTDVYVQDATAGIMIYQYGAPPYEFAIGDSVTINGTIAQYRGMTEVDMTGYTVHSTGHAVPPAQVRVCDDVEHVFQGDYSEPDEGRLVRLNNVTWTGSWPTFSGGVTLHDESGSCTMYIDGTTGIQDMTPPSGAFDVIGVIKQYDDFTPPYTTNYELLPRSDDDFIVLPGPQFTDGPYETDIQANQVTIHFETDTETFAIVCYGETEAYEYGCIGSETSTVHDVTLTGMNPATIHHYYVSVEDDVGQTTTPDLLFCSGSGPGSTGQITSLFNKSVDHTYALHGDALGNQDLAGWIIDRINATDYSIDVAIYSFDLSAVADALIAAKDRGVRVRFVYDNRDTYQAQVTRLQNNGIIVIDDAYGANDGNAIMHHKMWIFDALSPDPADAWFVTGSWNLSVQGTLTDMQNVILIQDQAMVAVATVEFNEMWGSDIWLPDPDESRFGDNKIDDTPKRFNVGGKEVELYFAPSDPWINALIYEVRDADVSINFCILSYTRYDLSNEMRDRWMDVPGFKLRGVFDSAESGNTYSQYHRMNGDGEYAWDPPADVLLDQETGTLHHKYMIIDHGRPGYDPVLATGSANWSNAAVNDNDENIVIVHDKVTANMYFQEFAARYQAAGGTDFLGADAQPGGELAVMFRVGPNPVLFDLQASFTLESAGHVTCDLFAPDGRRVGQLANGSFSAGPHLLRWEPTDAALPSGIYYVRLTTPQGTWTRSMTVVR